MKITVSRSLFPWGRPSVLVDISDVDSIEIEGASWVISSEEKRLYEKGENFVKRFMI